VALFLAIGSLAVARADLPGRAEGSRGAGGGSLAAVDEARIAAAGIRKLSGRHLTLFTDLPPGEKIDSLPAVFDLALPQWCQYFGIPTESPADWRVIGTLIRDKALFQKVGLLPRDASDVHQGYFNLGRIWVFEQTSTYYQRHLLLHEGTHAFMQTFLGGTGPPWYAEGMAELLGTHRWQYGRLTLDYMPVSRDEVPLLGRVRLVQDAVAAHRAKHLQTILDFGPDAHRETEAYAWCWALAALLDKHPRYRERFRALSHCVQGDLNREFHRLFAADQRQLAEEWQLFAVEMQYGYDFARCAIDFTPGAPLAADGKLVRVAADRGWQNSGLRLQAGARYQLTASGRYQLASPPNTWWCEPGGVSIHYFRGWPLGILLAAVRDPDRAEGTTGLVRPMVVGLGASLVPEESGTLYFKVNDSPGELYDNSGSLSVQVVPR
jgi:hypothetical protein